MNIPYEEKNNINSEVKARCNDQEGVRFVLQTQGADYKGLDHQIDTYFQTHKGKLKYRQMRY